MYPRVHPAMLAFWKRRQGEGEGEASSEQQNVNCEGGGGGGGHWGRHWGGGGWGHRGWGGGEGAQAGHDDGGESFGVRRPLRFLAYKLDLDEEQVSELAKILSDLKTERAQAAVDNRRSLSAFADAIAGDAFDEKKATEASSARVKSAESLRDAVVKALGRIHAILHADQRERLAYLIRTGG